MQDAQFISLNYKKRPKMGKKSSSQKQRRDSVIFLRSKSDQDSEMGTLDQAEYLVFTVIFKLLKAFAGCVAALPRYVINNNDDPKDMALYMAALSLLKEALDYTQSILEIPCEGRTITTYDKDDLFFGPQFNNKQRLEMLTQILSDRIGQLPELSRKGTNNRITYKEREFFLAELKVISDAVMQNMGEAG